MSYFAAALARTDQGWTGVELDLDEVEDLESLTDLLRDLAGDGLGPSLLLLEENDEHIAVVRVNGGAASLEEAHVFLSDRRAVQGSEVAAMLWEDAAVSESGDDDEGARLIADPAGDAAVLADFGIGAEELVDLCAEEGLLPADVLAALCEKVGCLDVLEQLREG